MRKCWYRRWLIVLLIVGTSVGGGLSAVKMKKEAEKREVSKEVVSKDLLIPGGMPVGIYMKMDGVMVLGTEKIKGADGLNYEPAEHLVKAGDYIVGINHVKVTTKKELQKQVGDLTGDEVILKVRRAEEEMEVKLHAVRTREKQYQLGIWVRDNMQGLGTVTFLDGNSRFGALGHGIHDIDTNVLLDITSGTLYETRIQNIQKGQRGTPGGMEGIIVYNRFNVLGDIERNTDAGIYGTIDRVDVVFADQTPMKIGKKEEIKTGKAEIRCAADGTVKNYEIEITRVNTACREVNKGIVLQVTDPKLLELTGGIVQGMSGSPIIQDGKLIGAVTHVFVQDATKGYGIFIENMLENVKR